MLCTICCSDANYHSIVFPLGDRAPRVCSQWRRSFPGHPRTRPTSPVQTTASHVQQLTCFSLWWCVCYGGWMASLATVKTVSLLHQWKRVNTTQPQSPKYLLVHKNCWYQLLLVYWRFSLQLKKDQLLLPSCIIILKKEWQ